MMARECRWCGMIHGPKCPSVKAMEFYSDGSVKRVEFFGPNDYPPLKITSPSGAYVPNILTSVGSYSQSSGHH